MYRAIRPEAAGELAPSTTWTVDAEGNRVIEEPLQFEFAGWLGDDLVYTSGYWVVSDRLAQALRSSDLSGFRLAEVVVTKNEQWDLQPQRDDFPETWERFVPTGAMAEGTDFALERRVILLANERALTLLHEFRLDNADISDGAEPEVPDYMQRFLANREGRA